MRLIFAFFAVFLLLGCGQVQQPARTECNPPYYEYTPNDCCLDSNTDGICDREQEQVPETIVLNKTAEVQEEPTVMEKALAKAGSVASYSYKDGGKSIFVQKNLVHTKLDKVIALDSAINSTMRGYVTDIFIDRKDRTATGYCDPRTEKEIMGNIAGRSSCAKLANMPIKLSFEEYNPRLPEDWLAMFAGKKPFLTEESEQFIKEPTGWKTISPVLHFMEGKKTTILRLESKTGLPLKVEIIEEPTSQVIAYSNLVQNSVRPEEITYQQFPV